MTEWIIASVVVLSPEWRPESSILRVNNESEKLSRHSFDEGAQNPS